MQASGSAGTAGDPALGDWVVLGVVQPSAAWSGDGRGQRVADRTG